MTILFAGGENTSFTAFGTATNFAGFGGGGIAGRSSLSRGGMIIGTAAGDPAPNRVQTPTFTAGSLLWIHGQASFGNNGSSVADAQALIVRSPDGVSRIVVRQTATPGLLKVSTRSAAAVFTDLFTSSVTVSQGTNHQFDLMIDYSVAGSIVLYLDGASVGSFSGNPRTDAATTLNQVDFGSLSVAFTIASGWSECIIANQDTRSMALWTLAPQASGNTQSWTPNTLTNINKMNFDDATFVSTTANNALSQWTTPVTPPSGVWNVLAIVQEARVKRDVTGPQHFDWLLRTAGTNYLAGTSQAPIAAFGNFNNQIWATNPSTAAPWVIGDIAAGFNLGIESLA